MPTEKNVAVSGTRRAMKELVDGTIRVQIDIDPQYRDDFFRLFGEIDMMVALVPLQHAPSPQPEPEEKRGWKKLGPLAQSTVLLCKEEGFQRFVAETKGSDDVDEEDAADFLREWCKVATRKELDTVDGAKERLGSLMAQYREWLH